MRSITHTIGAAAAAILSMSALALAGSETVALAPAASSAGPAIDCVRRDIQAITLMDTYGEAQAFSGPQMFENFMIMQAARTACHEGRASESLALYDSMFAPTKFGHAGERTNEQVGQR